LKYFLDDNEEPLSAEAFDNTEILLQLPLTTVELDITSTDSVVKNLAKTRIPRNIVDQHSVQKAHYNWNLLSSDPNPKWKEFKDV
jgi:hypothetical protein